MPAGGWSDELRLLTRVVSLGTDHGSFLGVHFTGAGTKLVVNVPPSLSHPSKTTDRKAHVPLPDRRSPAGSGWMSAP